MLTGTWLNSLAPAKDTPAAQLFTACALVTTNRSVGSAIQSLSSQKTALVTEDEYLVLLETIVSSTATTPSQLSACVPM